MPRPATSRQDTPSPGGWTSVVESIGPKVKALRQERGLTLQQLAHTADVSAAAVHKVERGDMVPTITTLLKLAHALDMPIRHFVEDRAQPPTLATHTKGVQPPDAPAGATTISGPADRFRTHSAVHRLEPGAQRKGRRRPGETLLLVVDGALRVAVGPEEYELGAGESLHYPTSAPHTLTNEGETRAQYVAFSLDTP